MGERIVLDVPEGREAEHVLWQVTTALRKYAAGLAEGWGPTGLACAETCLEVAASARAEGTVECEHVAGRIGHLELDLDYRSMGVVKLDGVEQRGIQALEISCGAGKLSLATIHMIMRPPLVAGCGILWVEKEDAP